MHPIPLKKGEVNEEGLETETKEYGGRGKNSHEQYERERERERER
jgi:hypothetical protein